MIPETTTTEQGPATPDLPDAIVPHYPTGELNNDICLYSGPLRVCQAGKSIPAQGRVFVAWLPSPAIRFEINDLPSGEHLTLDDSSLELNDGTQVESAHVNQCSLLIGSGRSSGSCAGVIRARIVRRADAPVTSVLFLLPNLHFLFGAPVRMPNGGMAASRLTLCANGWRITLDATENQKSVETRLKNGLGFGVTYVGRLEREDRSTFTVDHANYILDALAWYTSFAVGRWTGPCLPSGFDSTGREAWQVWHISRTVPFRTCFSWLDANHGEQFEDPFTGFLKLWSDEDWRDVIRVAIHWYVEANAQAGSIEGAIVLTQTAFELLASAILVERYRWLSTDGFEKLAAADRIRLLFRWAGIPTEIPAALPDLKSQAQENNWIDAAGAMTAIRNTISHPTRKNRDKFDSHKTGCRMDAWQMGLWGLELCLLRMFEYRGDYANRITSRRFTGEVEKVPWD